MAREITLALVQTAAPSDSQLSDAVATKKRILDSYHSHIEQAANQGVDLLALPAFANSLYFCHEQSDDYFALAEYMPEGDSVQSMMVLARQYNMVMVLPMMEIDMAGMYYHSVAVIDADGSYLGKYRQSHIQQRPHACEAFYFRAGNLGFPVFETAAGTLGLSLGYDAYFPEAYRILGLAGAEVVIQAGAVVVGQEEHWQRVHEAHAFNNAYYLAAVNRKGQEEAGEFAGKSFVLNARGQRIAQADENDSVISATLDLDALVQVRLEHPIYRDRRPELYEELVAL